MVITILATLSIFAENKVDSTKTKSPFNGMQKTQYDANTSPVHQWIALQAYLKLPSGDLKTELATFILTDPNSNYYSRPFTPPSGWNSNEDAPYIQLTALIEGTWEEDNSAALIPEERSKVHFWDPDSTYDAGLTFLGSYSSALQTAQARFYQAISYYNVGNKTKAYYWLGRTAHLLQDLSVPAHCTA